MAEVTMPALGESVTEGTVTQWLKAEGDTVAVDEPLLEVSTDKVDTEIPSPFAGVLTQILVQEDEVADVGAVLAHVGDAGDAPAPAAESAPAPVAEAPTETLPVTPAEAPAASGCGPDAGPDCCPGDDAPAAAPASAPASSGDAVAVDMPALGESVTEGTVTQWLKSVGDTVDVDEPLLEVSTDKVDTEIPSPVAGTLLEILVAEDEVAEVGASLARIGSAGSTSAPAAAPSTPAPAAAEAPAPAAPPAPVAPPAPEAPAAPAPVPTPEPVAGHVAAPAANVPQKDTSGKTVVDGSEIYVTPLVRKLAQQHGVDLTTVQGTGVGGRIRKQDVVAAAEALQAAETQAATAPAPSAPAPAAAPSTPATAPAAPGSTPAAAPKAGSRSAAANAALAAKRGTAEPMSRLRKVIASRMVESLQVSAQLTTVVEVDVTAVARLRAQNQAEFTKREGMKLSFMPFFAMAAIDALKQFPMVNASVEDDKIIYHPQENLGIAVDTERGLLVPVIRDAGDLNIAGLNRKVADLAARTRDNRVMPDELSGGTFTLTNTGSRGALFDTPIINQPQVAILGTGAVVKRPVAVSDDNGGEYIAIRSMAYLALTYDHRVVDGADAARFLSAVKDRLEEANFEV